MRILEQTCFGRALSDMRRLLVVVAVGILTLPHSSRSENDHEAKVLQYKYNSDGKGNYNFSFKTSNGITREESGIVVDEGLPSQYILVIGNVIYYTPDGNKEEWTYTADKNGYHAEPVSDLYRIDSLSPGVLASLLGK